MNIRIVDRGEEPWFVAADTCRALGFTVGSGKSPARHLGALARWEKDVKVFDTLGGPQSMLIIAESGLYKLIMRASRSNPNAAAFQDWVTREVLPSIRKTGGYIQGQEGLRDGTMTPELLMAKALKVAEGIGQCPCDIQATFHS